MSSTSYSEHSTERAPLSRLRRRSRGHRRAGFRPTLETVEDRCLLSSYTVTDLTFPGGYLIAAGAVNNLGQVAGRGVASGLNNAVVWQSGSIINLDPQQLHGISYAIDLTNPANASDVQVVGDMGNGDVFLWVGGTMYDTGIPSSANPGWQLAISNSRVVAGGYHPSSDPSQTHAFVWTDGNNNHVADPGELQDLNSIIPNSTFSAAEDISDGIGSGDHKKVVADALVTVPGGGQQWRAFLLTDQNDNGFASGVVVTDLGTLPKGGTTQASAVNDVGQVTGSSGASAFRWQNGVMTNIGQLNRETPAPGAINHSGQTVGFATGSSGQMSAWVWTGSGKIQDLNGLIPKKSGWLLQDARGLNDAGQIVVDGQKSGSNVGACLLTLNSTPASAVTIAAASPTDQKTTGLAPLEAVGKSSRPRTVTPPSSFGPQESSSTILLEPATEQDPNLLATVLIHPGTKRPRSLFQS
jgi:probable HAF family extracellular repeat protein